MLHRFRESRDNIYSLTLGNGSVEQNQILVKCPHCHSCAIVVSMESVSVDRISPLDTASAPVTNRDLFAPHRFVCSTCGVTKDWAGNQTRQILGGEPVDLYFQYPLWLQTNCCGHTLWAYNFRHLDLLAAFVSAKLRESRRDEKHGWSNQSLYSRLPQWMKSRKNRSTILKTIEKMRLEF